MIESPTEALAALGIELRGEEATKLSNEVKTLTAAADLIAGSISLNERIELKAGGTGLRIQEQRDRKSGDI